MSVGCEVDGVSCVDGGAKTPCGGTCDERRRVQSTIKEAMRVTGLSRDEVLMRANGLATIIFDAADMLREKFTPTAISNLFTMTATGEVRPEVALPEVPSIPPIGVRILRARLILEETLETINALGFKIKLNPVSSSNEIRDMSDCALVSHGDSPDLEGIIDGCCDVIYVATGTLLACGVPDAPHLEIVNRANNAKFPGGVATLNEYGKFQKPAGWEPPDHMALINDVPSEKLVNVRAAGQLVVAVEKHAAEKSSAEKNEASPA